jgi:hypothetical protein
MPADAGIQAVVEGIITQNTGFRPESILNAVEGPE